MAAARTAQISRKTNETEIEVFINLDCQPGNPAGLKQEIQVSTGIGFLDHVSLLRLAVLFPLPRHKNITEGLDVDVQCIGKTLWHVLINEVQRRSMDRRPSHCRYVPDHLIPPVPLYQPPTFNLNTG
jgi:hypothetical protein